jgi:hypothetical protein
VTFWESLEARSRRREARRLALAKIKVARQRLLIDKGLDWRSLVRAALSTSDPRFMVALSIIGLFAWAFAREADKDTRNLMVGALIAAFAGAWGYYLGSSNNAARANDRADKATDLSLEAMKAVPKLAEPDVTLAPGETAQAEPVPEKT